MGFRRSRKAERLPVLEILGRVTCPGGDLFLIDFGLLRLWSGEAPPLLGPHLAAPDIVRMVNEASDFEIVGRDAVDVARLVDLAVVKGRFAFDVPDAAFLSEKVAVICQEHCLEAEVVAIERVPHLDRLHRLLREAPGGVEVPFPGGWGVAVRGVPAGSELQVLGRRMDPAGPDAARWHAVWVQCGSAPVAQSHEAGYVLVDEARLLFCDPQVLGGWRSDEPIDGLADVAFWGGDELAVAKQMGARPIDPSGDDHGYGWTGQRVDDALALVRQLEALKAEGLRFAFDYRPHDDHHRLLTQARSSTTESAVIEVGGESVTGLFTTWGDGAYPVYRDVAADGTLVAVRVELGAPEIVARTRRMEELWFGERSKLALVSARVFREDQPIRWLYREPPDNKRDSGWRIFGGDESDDYANDDGNCAAMPLREILDAHPDIERLLDTPAPASFERNHDGTFEATEPPE